MIQKRAQEILQALVQGIDPLTGEELPPATVLQHADVLRALLAGATALGREIARAARRQQLPPQVGREWSPEEEDKLVREVKAGKSLEDIAIAHGRTVRAIEARGVRLDLLADQQLSDGFPVLRTRAPAADRAKGGAKTRQARRRRSARRSK